MSGAASPSGRKIGDAAQIVNDALVAVGEDPRDLRVVRSPDLLYVAGLGHAVSCAVNVAHAPRPFRFVWHHLLPQAAGGETVRNNLVAVCDNCHYAIHLILWRMANGHSPGVRVNADRLKLARRGYLAAKGLGTLGLIPNEGGDYS